MKVLLAGGGTGGHIFPAITIAQTLREQYGDVDVLFVGAQGGLEATLVPKAGFPFVGVPARYLRRELSAEVFRTAWTAWRGFAEAWRIVGRFRPDVAVGTGGYVSGPVIAAAALRRVPVVLQEQNALPGLTTRLLARAARRIALGSAAASGYFASDGRAVVTGNPIRRDILRATRDEALAAFGLDPRKKTLLVFGGSQGGRTINRAMIEAAPALLRRGDVQIIQQTGPAHFAEVVEAAGAVRRGEERAAAGDWHILSFIYDMPKAYAAADLVLCRAGAITLAEITAKGLPAVLVPYPFAAERHQDANAAELAQAGAALVVPDAELTGQRLLATVQPLLDDDERRRRMGEAARRLGRPDAAERIAALIREAARKPDR